MKSLKNVQESKRSKKASKPQGANERLLPAEVKNKTLGLTEQGRYVGKRWYPQAKTKR